MIKLIKVIIISVLVTTGGSCNYQHIYEGKKIGLNYSTSNILTIEIYAGSSSVNTTYIINKINNQVLFNINKFNCGKKQQISINITLDELNQILAILKRYEVQEWNNFNRSSTSAGAYGFGLIISCRDGNFISAHGDGQYPKNYHKYEIEMFDYLRGLVTTHAN